MDVFVCSIGQREARAVRISFPQHEKRDTAMGVASDIQLAICKHANYNSPLTMSKM